MKNLPGEVRNKAIEIANALLEERQIDEGIAIATAISRAKDWAVNRGKRINATNPDSKSKDVKQHGQDRYVIPFNEHEWAIKNEGAKKVEDVFRNKTEAVKQAKREARKANASVTVQKRTGQVQYRVSYNPNNRGRRQG